MRRPLAFLFTCLVSAALLAGVALTSPVPVSAATTIAPTTTCSNGVDNTGGLGLICRVTIVNTITASGSSATVTVEECHGAAGDPRASCLTHKLVLGSRVTNVDQCNGSTNGGGATLQCSVSVTNNFVGLSATTSPATVNQCVGSGGGITVGCDPFPATTSGATVTQCNGSGNGGTLVGLTCTVSGTRASRDNVTVNQCNGSSNGGGSLTICSASIRNVIIAAPTPTPTATPRVTPRPTATPIVTPRPTPTRAPTPTPVGATPTPIQAPPAATPTAGRPTPTLPGQLPPTSTSGPIAPADGGPAPLIPAGLLLLVGLGLFAWFKSQNANYRA